MNYISILISSITVWFSAVIIASQLSTTNDRKQLFMLVLMFNLAIFAIGFGKRR